MTLLDLIRKKSPGGVATAIHAIPATAPQGKGASVAEVATVAVAILPSENPNKDGLAQKTRCNRTPLTSREKAQILAWLKGIGETDAGVIQRVIDQCEEDAGAKEYFLGRARHTATQRTTSDDRVLCKDCRHLAKSGLCAAAAMGQISDAIHRYHPVSDLPRRCDQFKLRE